MNEGDSCYTASKMLQSWATREALQHFRSIVYWPTSSSHEPTHCLNVNVNSEYRFVRSVISRCVHLINGHDERGILQWSQTKFIQTYASNYKYSSHADFKLGLQNTRDKACFPLACISSLRRFLLILFYSIPVNNLLYRCNFCTVTLHRPGDDPC